MRKARSESEEKPAWSEKGAPVPECLQCTRCGEEAEIWSDEEETACRVCGGPVRR